jgi:hypothetical protein
MTKQIKIDIRTVGATAIYISIDGQPEEEMTLKDAIVLSKCLDVAVTAILSRTVNHY